MSKLDEIGSMTDDEIAALDLDSFSDDDYEEAATKDGGYTAPEDSGESDDDDDKGEVDEESEEETTTAESETSEEEEEESEEESDDSDGDSEEDSESEEEADTTTDLDESEDKDKATETETDDETTETDTKVADKDKIAAYDLLMGSFKANGVDITPRSVDDALNLMKMGANYHKKMVGIKPLVTVGRTLEKNNIDTDRLNFLIDLHNGEEKAITQLLRDNKINPVSIDVEADTGYTATEHSVSDEEVNLTEVVEDIKSTPTGKRTLDVVNAWDVQSRDFLAKNPTALNLINGHVASGHYDQIQAEVENQRVFGKLAGLSHIEAYHKVGNELYPTGSDRKEPEVKTVVKPKVKKAQNADVKSKKRSASASITTKSKSTKDKDFDPSKMSDKEIQDAVASGLFD